MLERKGNSTRERTHWQIEGHRRHKAEIKHHKSGNDWWHKNQIKQLGECQHNTGQDNERHSEAANVSREIEPAQKAGVHSEQVSRAGCELEKQCKNGTQKQRV